MRSRHASQVQRPFLSSDRFAPTPNRNRSSIGGRIFSRKNPLQQRRLLRVLSLVLLLTCRTGLPAHAEGDYELGHGYDIGPLNFAGYSNVIASAPDNGRASLVLDDLSLFVSGHIGRLINPFTEAELTHLDLVHSGRSLGDAGDFVLERLYNDSYLTDSVTLRLGKMLAPVGEWNEIHAAPLVLTTVRPAVTYRNFSEYVTGGSFLYSDPSGRFPELQFYWQPSGEFSERPQKITFHQYNSVEGAHVSFPIGLLDKVGLSFQQSKDVRGFNESLYGFDFHYTINKLTFAGEGTFADISDNAPTPVRDTEWGAYAAVSYALAEKWSVYSWYEGFAERMEPTEQDLLFGAAYRPDPAIVIKLEYLQNIGGRQINRTGLFASWSVLF